LAIARAVIFRADGGRSVVDVLQADPKLHRKAVSALGWDH
jgi:hypothetical protein